VGRRRALPVADLLAVAAGVGLVVAVAVVGRRLLADGVDLLLPFPPLLARWLPHVGPGTPLAVATAVGVATSGPMLAARLRWAPLLVAAWATAVVWTLSLALVDGWHRGVVERLSSGEEYLHDVPRVIDVGRMLATFSDHILTDAPGFWTTHVGAHPPGVLLLYVWLDRLGLGGGGAAGVATVLVGASACVAVAVALQALGAEDVARRALPFGVLLPGAVWVGVSADGVFAAVLAWGVALLAVGATGRGARADAGAVVGGLLLGYALYLSYGLVLGGLLPLAVVVATRAWRAAALATVGVAIVVLVFSTSGFWWFTGLAHVRVIYAASIAATRPYSYFVWANLAAVSIAVGPAVYAGIRRAVAAPRALSVGVALLPLAALVAILLADLSGLSKGEVERIWLPFAVWLVVPCALLPRPQVRAWLAAQALLALAVNHLLLTVW
jgi:methylthioxylose transferase